MGQEDQLPADSLVSVDYSGVEGMGKLFLFFLLIIALFILFIYLIKKFRISQYGKSVPTDDIKVVHTLYIDQKKKILFLKMFEEIYVLGSSDNNINLITKITDSETLQKFSNDSQNISKRVSSKFQKILKKRQ
ncbi:MAG: flagellar biosynthetic protein FliO [Candidatus Cloacimonadota bacterium]|nr:flagellar biosynthetic protein FliO [Candidatus Cloacimonadota bacterium]